MQPLLQEILDIVEEKGLTPIHDKKAGVKCEYLAHRLFTTF